MLYADDILLIAPTVSKMENLLHICERKLYWLDMSINFKEILLYAHRTALWRRLR